MSVAQAVALSLAVTKLNRTGWNSLTDAEQDLIKRQRPDLYDTMAPKPSGLTIADAANQLAARGSSGPRPAVTSQNDPVYRATAKPAIEARLIAATDPAAEASKIIAEQDAIFAKARASGQIEPVTGADSFKQFLTPMNIGIGVGVLALILILSRR